jgi:rSAM/selenodomain-associated transferase 2
LSDLAVVIPTLNEAPYLPGLLGDLGALTARPDVIVVDGGSQDDTLRVAANGGARTLLAPRGRASQMNTGAGASTGRWLCFLHADVRMPAAARSALEGVLRTGGDAVAVWRFGIEGAGLWFRLVELGARLRDRLGGLPYGDQGLLVPRRMFEAVGGFPEIPIMEDVVILRTLRRRHRLVRLPASLRVSPRRWRREGPFLTWFRNMGLITAFLAGVSPERLSRWYPPDAR